MHAAKLLTDHDEMFAVEDIIADSDESALHLTVEQDGGGRGVCEAVQYPDSDRTRARRMLRRTQRGFC